MKEYDKYWICDDCAKKQRLVHPGGCGTVVMGKCGHYKSGVNEVLTPIVDFNDPKSGRRAIFD